MAKCIADCFAGNEEQPADLGFAWIVNDCDFNGEMDARMAPAPAVKSPKGQSPKLAIRKSPTTICSRKLIATAQSKALVACGKGFTSRLEAGAMPQ